MVAEATERDPVCGMMVSSSAPERASLDGRTYFFCCAGCRAKFEAEPQAYRSLDRRGVEARAVPRAQAAASASAQGQGQEDGGWTCPMHPEVRRDGPGDCPICGMALEPIAPMPASDTNPELADMTRRFWVSAALTLPVVALAMAKVEGSWVPWVQAILAGIVVMWGGQVFFARALASLGNRRWNMFTLIGLGVAVSYGYSLTVLAFPDLMQPLLRDSKAAAPVYFEAAAAIITLVLLGQVLELRRAPPDRGGDPGAARPLAQARPPDPARRQR